MRSCGWSRHFLLVQDNAEKGLFDFDFAVVFDEAELPELVHEHIHSSPGRTDHFRESFLAKLADDRLRRAFLAEICKEKKEAGEALFARIEELVDEVLFNSAVPSQKIRHEKLGKFWLIMHGSDHGAFFDARNQAFIQRYRRCHPQRMAIETAFAEKVTGSKDTDDRFLAMLGNDGELDLALLDVENSVAGFPLCEDDLILPIF